MKKLLIAGMLLAFSSPAMAFDFGGGNNGGNKNTNENTNLQGQAQGQLQAQGQAQAAVAISGGNEQANSQAVTVHGDEAPDIPVSSAYAPGLTSSNGSCMGSSSGGAQGMGFGLSIGSTWMDEDCDRRYDANTLSKLGAPEAALALMCQKADVAEALKKSSPAKYNAYCAQPEVKTAEAKQSKPVNVASRGWFTSTDGSICHSEYKPSCVRPE